MFDPAFVGGYGGADGCGEIGFWLGEGGDKPWVAAEEIGDDGYLAIAGVFPTADADGGHGYGGGDAFCYVGDDGFEDDGADAGLAQGEGIGEETLGAFWGAAFFPVGAFAVDLLGQHADVADDGDAVLEDGGDFFHLILAAF